MANIQSAKKRIKVIERKSAENKIIKSALKTQLKKFDAAIETGAEDVSSVYSETVAR